MPNTLEAAPQEAKGKRKLVPLAPFMGVVAATAAFIFSLIAGLNWQERLVVVIAAAALAVGTVFTVLEILRLGRAAKAAR
jgi:MFS superfamily sulfate permease-like transporter